MNRVRLITTVSMFLITLVLLELASLVLFGYLYKIPFSYSVLEQRREEFIAQIRNKYDSPQASKALYIFHPYLGYVGRPEAHPWGESKPPFNNYGMLSVPGYRYPYHKNADEFVVAVLGGSVAEVFANTAETGVNDYVGHHYGFTRKLVFVSLATGGYKAPQSLFMLQYALMSGFEFDAVLTIDGFNELALAVSNMDMAINPLYPSGLHTALMSKLTTEEAIDGVVIRHLSDIYLKEKRAVMFLSLANRFPFRYSVFVNTFAERWREDTKRRVALMTRELTFAAQRNTADELRGPSMSSVSPYETAAAIWVKSSLMTSAICQANNLICLHVLQPNQYVEGGKPLSANEKKIAMNPDNPWGISAREGYPYLRKGGALLIGKGVHFHDLSMIFKDVSADLYLDDCCHFNQAGNEILGKRIVDLLMPLIRSVTH